MTFGERLTQLRIENGYKNRTDFAEVLGIPSTTLRNYETDVREPGHKFLRHISKLFNVSADYLLCLTDEKEALTSAKLTTPELSYIEKYRLLDDFGKNNVETILENEWRRCKSLMPQEGQLALSLSGDHVIDIYRNGKYVPYDTKTEVKAAHNDYNHDFEEAKKMEKDIETLKRPKKGTE